MTSAKWWDFEPPVHASSLTMLAFEPTLFPSQPPCGRPLEMPQGFAYLPWHRSHFALHVLHVGERHSDMRPAPPLPDFRWSRD